ncbi:hypothetical protein ARAF_2329 [Arsenophonus endosymbiont of Aleurodicus floccissimus]|nr:hypothetical protein ARAF_2329 [Arsenophonus endosymbiont of Aleurodicus floccissimus]
MQYSNVIVLPTSKQPTMSSIEMVDCINTDRASKAKREGFSVPLQEVS